MAARYGDGLFDEELPAHYPEHSIELEVVFLQYLFEGRRDILGQDAGERGGERDPLAGKRREVEVPRKARARLLGRDHLQKLLLPGGAPNGGDEIRSTIRLDI